LRWGAGGEGGGEREREKERQRERERVHHSHLIRGEREERKMGECTQTRSEEREGEMRGWGGGEKEK
jgi:hypothetical protein